MDSDWVKKHTIKYNNDKSGIFIKYPSSSFKWIVNHLRLRAMVKSDIESPGLEIESVQDAILKENVTSMLFPGKEENFLGEKRFSSIILTSWFEDY